MIMFFFCNRDIINNVDMSQKLQDDLTIYLRNCAFWAVQAFVFIKWHNSRICVGARKQARLWISYVVWYFL